MTTETETILNWKYVKNTRLKVMKRQYKVTGRHSPPVCSCKQLGMWGQHPEVIDRLINRGELYYEMRVQVNFVNGKPWYKKIRLMPECYTAIQQHDEKVTIAEYYRNQEELATRRELRKKESLAKLIASKPTANKPSVPRTDLSALPAEAKKSRSTWQRRIASYKVRLRKYQSKPEPHLPSTKYAIDNCEAQINYFTDLINEQNAQYSITVHTKPVQPLPPPIRPTLTPAQLYALPDFSADYTDPSIHPDG